MAVVAHLGLSMVRFLIAFLRRVRSHVSLFLCVLLVLCWCFPDARLLWWCGMERARAAPV